MQNYQKMLLVHLARGDFVFEMEILLQISEQIAENADLW